MRTFPHPTVATSVLDTSPMASDQYITESVLKSSVARELSLTHEDAGAVEIANVAVGDGAGEKENFASVLKAVTFSSSLPGMELKNHSYMVKHFATNPLRRAHLKKMGTFQKEVDFYQKFVPLLKPLELKGQEVSIPRWFYTSDEVLVMENLKDAGFQTVDNKQGFDMAKLKLVLEQLARFHAYSHHLIHEKYPGGTGKFKRDFPTFSFYGSWAPQADPAETQIEQLVGLFFAVAADVVGEEDADLGRKMAAFGAGERRDHVNALHSPKEGGFNCIVHNDTWANNIMFKGDDSVMLIDWQLCRYGRPAVDLAYLIGSSTSPEFRESRLGEALDFYHSSLVWVLAGLGHDGNAVYPHEAFKRDFDESFVWAFVMAVGHSQRCMLDNKEKSVDMDVKTEEERLAMMRRVRIMQTQAVKRNRALVQRLVTLAREAENRRILV